MTGSQLEGLNHHILTLRSGYESDILEYKRNFNSKEVLITTSAFANTRGGTIIIGIDDSGGVKGVKLGNESIRDWANQISQGTEPVVVPEIILETIQDKPVVLVKIAESPIKPVSTRGRCFRRVGNSNHSMTPSEIAGMHLSTMGMSWDRLSVKDSTEDDLDIDIVKEHVNRMRMAGRITVPSIEDPLTTLRKLELMTDAGPTWAAILLFGKNPQAKITGSTIHCGRFRDPVTIIDDRMVSGTLSRQIDDAMEFVKKNIEVEFKITSKPEREQIWEYPLDAVREMMINAVCHRDYGSPSTIDIRIYDDKMVVSNPGGLPAGLTIEDLMKEHRSIPRNMSIAAMFYNLALIERWGSGIGRMRKACTDINMPEPLFEERQGGFQVTLRKHEYTEDYLNGMGLNDRQVLAVLFMNEHGSISASDLKGVVKEPVSIKTLYRDLQDLIDREIVVPSGKKRGRRYALK